jgi:3-isopropylmalate/(R)-2-methylmalate dehydratase small subunit
MPGKAWRLENDVNTDAIIPGRFLADWNKNPGKLKEHCFIDILPDFSRSVEKGDYIVAGTNFGCGSSREAAPIAIKMSGVNIIIAGSFARIFYRNCINVGVLALESAEASAKVQQGDILTVDIMTGVISNVTTGQAYSFKPVPPFLKEILDLGGLAPYIQKKLNIS